MIACVFSAVSMAANSEITTSLDTKVMYDDNIYRLQGDGVDSWVTTIGPGIQLELEEGASTYLLEAGAEAGIYTSQESGDDNYADYNLNGSFKLDLDARNQIELGLGHRRGHDARGTGRMDNGLKLASADSDEPDQWEKNTFNAKYKLGAKSSPSSLSLSGDYEQRAYTNNNPSTDALERANTEFRALGKLKILPKTSGILEARHKDIEYKEAVNRDSRELQLFVGAEWEATAQTTGSVRLGYQGKEPDDSSFDDFDSAAWEATVVWTPKSYSALEWTAFRGMEDSSSVLTYIDLEVYGLKWKHKWSDKFNTTVYGKIENQDFKDGSRKDDINTWGYIVAYNLTQMIELTGEYKYEERETSAVGLDYDRNTVIFSAGIDFE